jgi:hypothetical protein
MSMKGLSRMTRDYLTPGPDLHCEGAGAAVQDGIRSVHPDEGGAQDVPGELLWQLAACVVLARQRKREHLGFWKFFFKFDQQITPLPSKLIR